MLDVCPEASAGRPRGSVAIGSLIGVPTYASPWIVVTATLVALPLIRQGSSMVVAGAAIIIASILAHEFAHAAAAKLLGCRVLAVTIGVREGLCIFEQPQRGRDLALVILAGPACNLVLGAAAWGVGALLGSGGPGEAVVRAAGIINLMLGLANLMPSYSLDGSIVACLLLGRIMPHRAAARTVAALGYLLDAVWSCSIIWLIVFGLPIIPGIGGRNGRLWDVARVAPPDAAPPTGRAPGQPPRWLIRADAADGASDAPS